jgi:hypothetical protein
MKIWQAHKALADAVGDTADIDKDNLFDGVRYTKAERDSYLYQAMIRVFNKLLQPLKALPSKQMYMMAERYFPNMIKYIVFDYTGDISLNLFSYDLEKSEGIYVAMPINMFAISVVEHPVKYTGYPIPYKPMSEVNGLINTRNAFLPDLFYTFSNLPNGDSTVTIYDYQSELENLPPLLYGKKIRFDYLNYPLDPSTQGNEDLLDIEPAYYDMVITTAVVLMYRDDQEIEGIERIMSLIEPFMPGGR